jgi:hypothetical protein
MLTMKGSKHEGKGGGFEAQGEETPSMLVSSGDGDDEEDEDGEITPSPHSPPPKDLLSLGDLFSQQARIFIGVHRIKRPRMGTWAFGHCSACRHSPVLRWYILAY